jgi:uncharacterized protein Veg
VPGTVNTIDQTRLLRSSVGQQLRLTVNSGRRTASPTAASTPTIQHGTFTTG